MSDQTIEKKQILDEVQAMVPVAGARLGVAATNVKYTGRDDILLIELVESSQVAAVFTQNDFCAAPVIVARENISTATPKYLLVNAGNANAGTGEQGIVDANLCCEAVAGITNCEPAQVLPFSTGVIGEYLSVDRITNVLPSAVSGLKEDNWLAAAMAIMTTDTVPKGISRSRDINGQKVTVTGIAKGAGMIRPNMATMLSYVVTDAGISGQLLQSMLEKLTEKSFNRITVDGDTSTNDACVLAATGACGLSPVESKADSAYHELFNLLLEVFEYLAVSIIKDAEGATKLVNVSVMEGKNISECEAVAYTIAHSPLVKTALFASDPNWGRILAAIGRSGLENLSIEDIRIDINGVQILTNGARDPSYDEASASNAMQSSDVAINVYLGRGQAEANVWTCDLSYDYIKINAEYRT